MPRFIEAEIRNRLWKWYEREWNADVSAEVTLGTGRIDLIVEADGATTGIEVKGPTPTDTPIEVANQLRKYSESNTLDAVYLASNAVDDYLRAREAIHDPAQDVGVLLYPFDVTATGTFRVAVNCPPNHITKSGQTTAPVKVREPDVNSASSSYSSSQSEDWLHYRLWETYNGIAEGSLPNISGKSKTVNIDFLRFNGGDTATEIHAGGGDIVGYEAKKSLSSAVKEQTAEQLSRYWESECLSQLYLAVPEEIGDTAREWVNKNPSNLPSEIGVVTISDNSIEEIVPAKRVEARYDAFGHPDYPYHVGFGNAELPESPRPRSRLNI